MHTTGREIYDQFYEAARNGDGLFAIAYALLELSVQVKNLGTTDAGTSMGAIEAFGKHIGEKLDTLSCAIKYGAEGP